MLAVLGLVMLMGLVNLAEIRCHWDTRPMYSCETVRRCMSRDMFQLIYSRFFHMAETGAPKRGEDGYDILHHIR